eukprot:scaffold125660_cov60-Phaeocystis_antarctica.AAC.1
MDRYAARWSPLVARHEGTRVARALRCRPARVAGSDPAYSMGAAQASLLLRPCLETRPGHSHTGYVRRAWVAALQNETRVTVSAQFLAGDKSVEATQSRTPRLTIEQYIHAAHAHRFCLVSPGDTKASRKLAETMVLAAESACLPLVIAGTFLPYADELNYTAVVTRAALPRSREQVWTKRYIDR